MLLDILTFTSLALTQTGYTQWRAESDMENAAVHDSYWKHNKRPRHHLIAAPFHPHARCQQFIQGAATC